MTEEIRPEAQSVEETRVSFSSLTRHRKCPQAWVYDSVRHLEPDTVGPSVKREFGSWWHAVRAADSIRRGRALGSLVLAPEVLTTGDLGPKIPVEKAVNTLGSEAVLAVSGDWWARQPAEFRDDWVEKMGAPLPEHLEQMDARWQSTWREETASERPVAVELQVSRMIPRADGTPFRLDGQVDEVFYDRRGLLVVRDHKTGQSLPAAESLDDLLDSQTHVYAWLAAGVLQEHGVTSESGMALSYDRARSKVPSTPALTATGALSKSTSDYDLATYLTFTYEPVPWGKDGEFYVSGKRKGEPKFGTYERDPEVVARLDTPAERAKWNDRTLTPVNINIVRAHLRAARDTREQMDSTMESYQTTGQAPRNLNRMGCSWCDFSALCLAEIRSGGARQPDLDPADYGLRVERA